MGRYVAGRLLKAVLLLLAVSIAVFLLRPLWVSQSARQAREGLEVSPEEEQAICEEYGLKKPGIVERFKSSNSIKSMFTLEMGCTPKVRVPAQGANMETSQ